jgi:hypothetical protein
LLFNSTISQFLFPITINNYLNMPTTLVPRLIQTDLDTQARVEINNDVVKEYAEAMEAGNVFPPLLVYFDEPNNRYILVDGFHRLAAHCRLHPNDAIPVQLELGTLDEARWASFSTNKDHGLHRTNADKRRNTIQALKHTKGAELSDSQIGKHVGVDHKTVASIRRELEISSEIPKIETRTVQRGNQIYQQQTSRIGQSNPSQKTDLNYTTCLQCRYFEKEFCTFFGEERLPFDGACNDFAVIVPDPPVREVPPPDYDHVEPCDDDDDKPVIHRPFQNRRLKNCITVHLPPDNPQLFAVELREHCDREYLIACLAALKHLLEDKDD